MSSHGNIKPFTKEPSPRSLFRLVERETTGLMSMESLEDVMARRHTGLKGNELRQFWYDAFATQTLTLDDLYPYRVRAAWRMMRELSYIFGWIDKPETSIDEATDAPPSPWLNPTGPFVPVGDPIIDALLHTHGHVALLPPSPPEGVTEEEYDATADRPLEVYLRVFTQVAERLHISGTDEGRYGLAGLLDPQLVRVAMPGPREVIEFEALVVREALQSLVKDTYHGAEEMLRERYDLREHEVRQVMAMVRRLARSRIDVEDLEGARALCILRMESAIQQAQEAGDHRGQISGIEKLARLHGIDRGDADQDVDDMANEVSAIARERRKPLKTGGEED